MKNVLSQLCAALLLCAATTIGAQVPLVKNGKPTARIVTGMSSQNGATS